MLVRLLTLLRQPYPVPAPLRVQVRQALLIGLFVWVFLTLFQPFGIGLWQTPYKSLKLLGFGGVTTVVTMLHFVLGPRLFPRLFAENHWTVGRAHGLLLLNVLLIAVANYFYLHALLGIPIHLGGLLSMGLVTFSVAVFPVAAVIGGNYVRQLRHYQQAAATIPIRPSEPPAVAPIAPASAVAPPPLLTLTAENGKDNVRLPVNALLYLESSDNYCTVVYRQPADQIARAVLRSSLTRLESQLPPNGRIVRCHRSFVVNLNEVERVSGNAQGYHLHLRSTHLTVPVARKYNDSLVAQLMC